MNDRYEFLKEDYSQGFPAFCGFEVTEVAEGRFTSRLAVRPGHRQQDGFVHAGVIATMADHTAGYSAYTIVPDTIRILTIEFKINYFKPAVGDLLICRSRVVNRGSRIIVAESEISAGSAGRKKLVSKATVTLMPVPLNDLNQDRSSDALRA